MKIRLIGQRNTSGIGTHYACFSDALQAIQGIGHLVEEVDFTNHSQVLEAANRSQPTDINICFVAMNIHEYFQGYNIQWVVFESTRVPEHILNVLRSASQVWVPTAWGQDVLIKNGLVPDLVRVIPEGVDGDLFHTHGRQPWTRARPFRFLTVGKYEQRKSMEEILEAFAQMYANTEAIELVIKSNYFMNQDQKLLKLKQKIADLGLTNVNLLWGDMTRQELADMYRSCDAFVLPSRAEGWGLPLIEAAASGLPIISTDWSGHTEFLQHIKNSVLNVSHTITPIDCPEYQNFYPDINRDWGTWAKPDVHSIATALQTVCRDYNTLFEHACANSRIIRRMFSWQNSADLALAAMGPVADFRYTNQ